MRLELKGIVKLGDPFRYSDDEDQLGGAIYIGGTDLVAAVDDADFSKQVSVSINGEVVYTGDLFVAIGWGYSEYTPMDGDELKIGGNDLIKKLNGYADQEITLVLEDV